MKYLAKNPFLVILIFALLINLILGFILNFENIALKAGIAGGIAVILSPRKKIIQTQTGEKIQITWIFLKNTIILD